MKITVSDEFIILISVQTYGYNAVQAKVLYKPPYYIKTNLFMVLAYQLDAW